jgi:hypothetical protein
MVAQLFLGQAKIAIYRFAGAQQLAWLDSHFVNQVAQLLLAERLEVVIDFVVVDAALTEQFVQLATLGSSRLFVDCNFLRHNFGVPRA